MSNLKSLSIIKNGVIDENPAFRLILGMCPALAVTTSATNGLGMGLATTVVLMCSNLVISIIRKAIPSKVRIPIFITIIAGFVTIIQMLLKAYIPVMDEALGIYIPLIVVNCLILGRAEIFASKNKPIVSIADGFGMGIGFALALTVMGMFREILGNGSIFGFNIAGAAFEPALIMILPPGGFLAFGIIIGLLNKFLSLNIRKTGCGSCDKNCGGCSSGEEARS